MMKRFASRIIGRPAMISVAMLAGGVVGALLARGPEPALGQAQAHAKDVKAPISEVLHCPLSFAGVHLQKDKPTNAQIAYHYCKPLNSDVNQCILYDGTGPDARLIGIEYLVTDAIYQTMPEAEKAYWHDHNFEVDSKLIRSLTQSGAEEAATLGVVRKLWGKVYHTWVEGKTYPEGPPKLFWSVTGVPPLVLPEGAKLPPELKKAEAPHRP
jgi:Protein of unknown function (DUF1264)